MHQDGAFAQKAEGITVQTEALPRCDPNRVLETAEEAVDELPMADSVDPMPTIAPSTDLLEGSLPQWDAKIPFRWKRVHSRIRRSMILRRFRLTFGRLILGAILMYMFLHSNAYSRIYFGVAQLCRWDQSHSDWNYTELGGCNLSHLSFHKAYMIDVTLIEADLSHSDLSEMDFLFARAKGANFDGAKMCKVDLLLCDLTGASFRNADLTGACISGKLAGIDLRQARLEGCDFTGDDLSGVKLEGVNLRGLRYNKDTRWPKGFRAQDHPEMVRDDFIKKPWNR